MVKAKDASVLLVDKIWAIHGVQYVGYNKSSLTKPMKPQQMKNGNVLLDLTNLQKS